MPWSGPTNGLIHRWPLDLANLSGVIDSDVVGTINITESGTVTSSAGPTHAPNTARSFDGTTGTGAFASSPLPASGPYTASVWANTSDVNFGSGTGTAQTILNLGTNAGGNQIRLVEDNSTVSGGNVSPNGGFAWSSQLGGAETDIAVFTNSSWTQVAVTFDGATTFQTIVNGAVMSATFPGPTVPSANDAIASKTSSASFLFGSIAQLAIYNRVLSAVELVALYNADVSTLPSLSQQRLLFV